MNYPAIDPNVKTKICPSCGRLFKHLKRRSDNGGVAYTADECMACGHMSNIQAVTNGSFPDPNLPVGLEEFEREAI